MAKALKQAFKKLPAEILKINFPLRYKNEQEIAKLCLINTYW